MHTRCLILIYGGAFRNKQKSPQIGEEEIAHQKRCTGSHLGFVEYLKDAYGCECDTQLITYHTDYDAALRRWYDTDKAVFLTSRMPGAVALYKFAIETASVDESYDYLLFFRTDIALKGYFKQVFSPYHDKVMAPFPCSNHDKQPRFWVGDLLGFIPKELFHVIGRGFHFHHGSYEQMRRLGLADRFGVYVNSHHRANTALGWNPLYYLPARKMNKKIERPFMRSLARQMDYPYRPDAVYDIETIDSCMITSSTVLEV